MNTIQFTTTVGADGAIRPPAGVVLPSGEIEVSVRAQQTARADERLREIAVRRGLNPEGLDEVTRAVLLDELVYEVRGAVRRRPGPGAFRGVISYMAPDFDAPLEDMAEYLE